MLLRQYTTTEEKAAHANSALQVREAGARIKLISDGDVGGAIEVAKAGAAVDMMLGIGGTPEGERAAAAGSKVCRAALDLVLGIGSTPEGVWAMCCWHFQIGLIPGSTLALAACLQVCGLLAAEMQCRAFV